MKIIKTGFFLSAIAFLASCSSDQNEIKASSKPIEVMLSKSTTTDELGFAGASGKLVAKNSVNVSTRMMGYITGMKAEIGDFVKAGQPLVSINNTDIQAKGGQTDAQIAQAQANFNLAQKDFQRFQNLYNNQSASQKELDDMRARYEMAKANLDGARMMKNEVNSQYRYTNITAPISGVVTAKYASQGDLANPGMPILTIESSGNLQAQVLVSEQDITMIKTGMAVKVLMKSTNTEVVGNVAEVSLSSTNTGGQYLVKINMPQSDDYLPGMFVNVVFPFKRSGSVHQDFQESVAVPKSAIVEKGQLTGIYTVSSANTATLRWVKTGKTLGDQVEILSGLNSKEPYIVSAKGKLFNGAKVQVK
ncbi:efflux RND transporter periplasmic adaptor subunit [Chryseobacterium koreense]|uniref:RND transporter n=1 Tax=Chryseobacterium koreense CCUG 49689 TaxID=1304281 RepID=A0A0J7IW88_9FLAO|nr:efflux RND transporter periplasmic adaptor subunit [Chryseobacterium koreense]KMQ70563.1 RND transporter [Chryseobacterium koreense CCUG 49689]MBB5334364.1 RND family efflux transporter MFP subunit [Chryseobacterium koreense]